MKRKSTLKRVLLTLVLVLSFSIAIFSQTVNKYCQDGKVYFKIKENAEVTLTAKKGTVDWSQTDLLDKIVEKHTVTALKKPFYQAHDILLQNTYMLEFSDYSGIAEIIAELNARPEIEYAEPVPLFYILYVPNDPYYGYTASFSANADWHLDVINASQAWDITKGDTNVLVAVLDNAIWSQHPDLVNKIVNKIDLADNDTSTTPATMDYTFSHGTHTSGLVAAETDNNIGVASIGFNTRLIAVKVGRDSDGALTAGFEGIIWAADNGADIISMSWGSGQSSITGQNIVNYAYNKGVTLVAAAGNDSSNVVLFPAAYDNVIAVSATNEDDVKAPFSTYGPETDVCAPGGFATGGMGMYQILSTTYSDAGWLGMGALFGITGKYDLMAGTSMACPITAGLCALMLGVDSTLTPARLEEYLKASCVNIDAQNAAYVGQIGAGRINAFAAVQMAQDSIKTLVADFTASSTSLSVNGSANFTDWSIGEPVTWSWSFPGATPSTSTLQNPLGITYPNAGSYDVILTVTDTAGNISTETKSNLIIVQAASNSAWIIQASAFEAQYRGIMDICIVDPTTVWASAFDGSGSGATLEEFTKTVDGGNTWVADTIHEVSGYGIGNITAVDGQKAWVTLYNASASGGGKIMATTDGGATWTHQTSATYTGTSAFPNVVYFFDANNGFTMGDPNGGYFEIYTTTDGGSTWVRVPQADIPANISGEMGWTGVFDAVGDTAWFGTNKGNIYKSVDKGLHWTVITSGAADCSKISMADAMNGVMEYKVFNTSTGAITTFVPKRTTDGGETWTTITPTSGTFYKTDVSAVPGRPGFYVSVGGSSLAGEHGSSYSLDYGDTWTTLDTVQYTAVQFTSPTTGWAGGFNMNQTQEGMYKWANPPLSADEINIESNSSIYPVPSSGQINIEFYSNTKDAVNITVFDVTGNAVYNFKGKKTIAVYKGVFDLSSLSPGVYMALVKAGDQEFTKKIVIY
jgi:PKD repeat protein